MSTRWLQVDVQSSSKMIFISKINHSGCRLTLIFFALYFLFCFRVCRFRKSIQYRHFVKHQPELCLVVSGITSTRTVSGCIRYYINQNCVWLYQVLHQPELCLVVSGITSTRTVSGCIRYYINQNCVWLMFVIYLQSQKSIYFGAVLLRTFL